MSETGRVFKGSDIDAIVCVISVLICDWFS